MSMPAQSRSSGPLLVAVQDDVVSLRDDPLELDLLARILVRHALEVVDERLLAVGDRRVVLDVRRRPRSARSPRPAGTG